MVVDIASFRPYDVQSVYGERYHCLMTGIWQFCDLSHILGRSGLKMDDPRRKLYSSIFNCAPLNRDIHKGPLRDHRGVRLALLEQAERKVREAVNRGHYEISDLDEHFLRLIRDPWLKEL